MAATSTPALTPAGRPVSVPPKPAIDLRQVAMGCIREAGGKNTDAATLLADLAREDDDLYHAIMDGQLDARCYEIVSMMIRTANAGIRNKHQAAYRQSDATRTKVSQAKERTIARITDMMILGMGHLGNLTFAQVSVAATEYGSKEAHFGVMKRFCQRLVTLGRSDQVVGRVLNESRLKAIYAEVQA